MSGALGSMAAILLEAAAGGALVLWASRVYGQVRRGFILLSGVTLALCAISAWAITRSAVREAETLVTAGVQPDNPSLVAAAGPAGNRALLALGVFAAFMVLWQIVLAVRDSVVARVIGLGAVASGVVALPAFAALRGADLPFALAELVLGALFLGSALHGLLLGHWYLVERRLPKTHMERSAAFYAAGVVAAAGAVALSARNPAPAITAVASPVLAVPGFSVLLGAGLVAVCALIAGFVWKLAKEGGRSIQAATGMFYLAVIMAFSAELAAKFRFF